LISRQPAWEYSTAKPYLSATVAAAKIGVPRDQIIADIECGQTDPLALTGAAVGDWYVVEAWELDEPRLSMHRRRLADSASESRP
jgi:hypothetical protein